MHYAATAAPANASQMDYCAESAGKSSTKFVVAIQFSGLRIPHVTDLSYFCLRTKPFVTNAFLTLTFSVLNLSLVK